jgi:DNA invertase Pin-like site-specific DNA recombinase
MNVVIYCRVSTDGQAKGNGLARQLESCMKFASDNKHNAVGCFSDVGSGSSGKKLDGRRQAVKMAYANDANIIVETTCRFSREGVGRCEHQAFYDSGRVMVSSSIEIEMNREIGDALKAYKLSIMAIQETEVQRENKIVALVDFLSSCDEKEVIA